MENNEISNTYEHEIEVRQIMTDLDIVAADYPPPCWIVPGLLPEGLTVLAGKPKIGKSMLSLNLSVSIATGGVVLGSGDVEQKDVL